jgi:hypothetical protein
VPRKNISDGKRLVPAGDKSFFLQQLKAPYLFRQNLSPSVTNDFSLLTTIPKPWHSLIRVGEIPVDDTNPKFGK